MVWLKNKLLYWKIRSRIVACSLFAIVVALAASSFWAPSYTRCYNAELANNAENEKAKPNLIPNRNFAGILLACQGEFIDRNDKVIVAIFTVVLALSTIFLWLATNNIVNSTEESNRQINRAYMAIGGECQIDNGVIRTTKSGERLFRVEVGNHGKTLAYLDAFELEFGTEIQATGKPRPDVVTRYTHSDQSPPGERHRPVGPLIPITRGGDDVAFGTIHYRDIWEGVHYSHFILKIAADGHTHSNLIGSYRGSN